MAGDNTFGGRVAVITGASGGIGQALTARIATEGAAVALCYGSNAGPAEEPTAQILAGGGRAVALQADLRTASAPGALIDGAETSLGPVDAMAILSNPYLTNQVISIDGGIHPR